MASENGNSGNRNSGNGNSGNRNSGNWNSGNWNSGYFNNETPSTVDAFGKPCEREVWDKAVKPNFLFSLPLNAWVTLASMTEADKEANPSSKTTGGYLKTLTYKEAWAVAWSKRGPHEEDQLCALPNFDAEIFGDITGIDLNVDPAKTKLLADIAELKATLSQQSEKLATMKQEAGA